MTLLISVTMAIGMAMPAPTVDVVAKDSHGITVAVMQGDSAALQRIGRSATTARFAARAGYYRTRGDLAQSNHWATTCINDPGVQGEAGQGAMYLCRSLLAGNRLIAGDIQGWASQMQTVQVLYHRHVAPSLGAGETVSGVTAPDVASFQQWPPSATLAAAATPGYQLPIATDLGVPILRAKIIDGQDGKRRNIDADFLLDTGATRSHISRQAARSMGLSVTERFATDTSTPGRPAAIGLAAPVDVQLGELHFSNVSFTVTEQIPVNIIGLDMLYQLGPFVLRQTQLELLDSIPAGICRQPLTATSALWGNQYALRMPMRIGERDALVLLDTGADHPLQVAGADLSSFPQSGLVQRSRLTMHGLQAVQYAQAAAPVTFNGHTVNLQTQVTDQPAHVFPLSWHAGFGMHEAYDYYIDVAAGRGCLAPRPQT